MLSGGSTLLQRLSVLLGATEDREVCRVIEAVRERRLAAREPLFMVGERSTTIYFVVSGCVALSTSGRGGRGIILALLRAGDIAGETALVEDGVRRLSASALEPSLVAGIPCDSFTVLMQRLPVFACAVTRLLAERLLSHEQLIERLACQSVSSRLAQLLLELLARQHDTPVLEQQFTHNQLAQLVSTNRETVSALLSRFAKLGLIEYERSSITVLDVAQLGSCARGELAVSAR